MNPLIALLNLTLIGVFGADFTTFFVEWEDRAESGGFFYEWTEPVLLFLRDLLLSL